jgi:hypothetical protein
VLGPKDLQTLGGEDAAFFEMSVCMKLPTAQCSIQEDQNPQHHCCVNLKLHIMQ